MVHVLTLKKDFDTEIIKTKDNMLCMVDFTAKWCFPCQVIAPFVHELSQRYQEKMKIFEVNVNTVPSVVDFAGIESIPAFVFYQQGKEIDRIVGPSQEDLENKIVTLLNESKTFIVTQK